MTPVLTKESAQPPPRMSIAHTNSSEGRTLISIPTSKHHVSLHDQFRKSKCSRAFWKENLITKVHSPWVLVEGRQRKRKAQIRTPLWARCLDRVEAEIFDLVFTTVSWLQEPKTTCLIAPFFFVCLSLPFPYQSPILTKTRTAIWPNCLYRNSVKVFKKLSQCPSQ